MKLTTTDFLERSRTDRDLYFRGAVRIRPKDTKGGLIPLEMRPAQRRLMDAIDAESKAGRPPRVVILKARQIGFSTVAGAEMFRRCHLNDHQQALVVAHKAESAEYLFGNIHRIYDHLPGPVKPKKKFSAKRLIHFEANDSRLQVEVAGESRGFTAQVVHLSELAFVEDAASLLTAIFQTVPDTPESLIIVESTANGVGNAFHSLYQRAKKPGSGWIAVFVPWFEEPTYRIERDAWPRLLGVRDITPESLSENERDRMEKYGLSLEQVAWWRYTLENKCLGDLDRMTQEYPDNDEDAFLASGRPVIDRAGLKHYATIIEQRSDAGVVPRLCEIAHSHDDPTNPVPQDAPHGRFRIYVPPIKRHRYILAADLSAGDPGSDPCPSVVFDQVGFGVAAVWYGRTPPEVKAPIDHAIAMLYGGPRTVKWVWEANNHGILYGHVAHDALMYPNIHYRRTSEDSVSKRETDKPGFWTSGANRDHLFNLVRRFAREQIGYMWDADMLEEWRTLRYDEKTGRADHEDGSFSDLTVALGMALAVHSGGFDNALVPIPVEEMRESVASYQLKTAADSMGQEHRLVLSDGMTIADVEKYLARQDAIAKRRERTGMGRAR